MCRICTISTITILTLCVGLALPGCDEDQTLETRQVVALQEGECRLVGSDGADGLGVYNLNLDTLETQLAAAYSGLRMASGSHSVASVGDFLYINTETETAQGATELDRRTGAQRTFAQAGQWRPGFAGDEQGFYTFCGEFGVDICQYPSFVDMANETNGAPFVAGGNNYSILEMTVSPTHVYGSWFSTDRLWRFDRATGAAEEIILEGFDGWVYGLGVIGNTLLVHTDRQLDDDPWAQQLVRFDAQTGRRLGDGIMSGLLPGQASALLCKSVSSEPKPKPEPEPEPEHEHTPDCGH